MKIVNSLIFLLVLTNIGLCRASESSPRPTQKTPEWMVSTNKLVKAMARYSDELGKMRFSPVLGSRALSEQVKTIMGGIFSPLPLRQLLWEKSNPLWKVAALTPLVVPACATLGIGGKDLQLCNKYIRNRVELIAFKNNVEYFKLLLEKQNKNSARAHRLASRFLDQDYKKFDQHYINEIHKKLVDQQKERLEKARG